MRKSIRGRIRPWVARSAYSSSAESSTSPGIRDVAASGLVSVMPQPCTSGIPNRSAKPRISDSGTAAPPAFSSRRLLRSGGGSSSSIPFQIVGTPAVHVTRSCAMRFASPPGERSGPGSTCRAPTIVATYGIPHAIAWNIGTTGIAESASRIPIESGSPAPSV